jgi:hypothetical protein
MILFYQLLRIVLISFRMLLWSMQNLFLSTSDKLNHQRNCWKFISKNILVNIYLKDTYNFISIILILKLETENFSMSSYKYWKLGLNRRLFNWMKKSIRSCICLLDLYLDLIYLVYFSWKQHRKQSSRCNFR